MNVFRCLYVVVLFGFMDVAVAETIGHGRFEKLTIYRPQGEARQMVLLFSGERGWTADLEPIAQSLSRQGALVAGIDTPALFRNLEQDGGDCVSPDGDLENLSHFLQAYYRLPTYRPALLVGATSSGAAFVYAMLAQAPAGTFGGGISLGFCPTLTLKKPLCPKTPPADKKTKLVAAFPPPAKLNAPWSVLQPNDQACRAAANQFISKVTGTEVATIAGDSQAQSEFRTWEAQFVSAYQKIAARTVGLPTVAAAELKDLPLIEVKTKGQGDTLVLLISGDGGWAGIDKALAAEISKEGMPVIGIDSLRYFWKARTPQSAAADVDRVLRYYLNAWKKKSVLLIGFSQGADVMPFIVNRLPTATRERVKAVALLALSQTAVFEFHLQNWLGRSNDSVATEPEVLKMKEIRTLCVYGEEEEDSLCRMPAAQGMQVIKLKGGHHFDGDYASLAKLILARAR